MITTPRGMFDPNFGWIDFQQGLCSLDLDLMLHYLYMDGTQKPPYVAAPLPGLMLAFQLQSVSADR